MNVVAPDNTSNYRLSRTLGDIMQARALQIDVRRQEKDKWKPIPTNIPALNDIILGFPVEQPFYMLLFSSEKIGKTTIGMDMAEAWRKGMPVIGKNEKGEEIREPVMYAQLEELGLQYADRTFARMTPSVSRTDIRMFNINDEQMQEIYDEANKVSEGGDNLYIQDDLFSLHAIIQEAKRIKCRNIVIDNLQLIDQKGFGGQSSQERFAAISRHLVKMRNQEGFSFIVVSQMGQEGRAFGSGQANRDADILIQIENVYQKDDEDEDENLIVEGQRCLHVLPGRIGGAGKCYVTFDGNKNKIGPIVQVDINSQSFLDLVQQEGPSLQIVS